ncbi:unnamed protein product [Trifolium pratense]|uniref:Uncharacterized protein n=1 Tax=Trifolium pratense TaxID=57577 RepID=A0ACB0IGY3_TRIPR|nr:unnamed protein product [Trifolium pratense]
MGREVTGIQVMEKKANGLASNGSFSERVRVSPKIAAMVQAMDHEIKEAAEEKNEKSEEQKMDDDKEVSSPAAIAIPVDEEHTSPSAPQQSDQATEKHVTHTQTVETEAVADDQNLSPKANNIHSPSSSKSSQPNSPLSPRKLAQHDKKHHDDEDNWSNASSVASARTSKPKVTVGTAPTFRIYERAEKRKEFYMRLEEKNRALEEERLQYEARKKEEEDAALKQLRKNLVIKAKPVPSFYYEAPPPKKELKKQPPLTCPKSPKLSRRKSCGDAINSSPEVCTRVRHSFNSNLKNGSSTQKNKDLVAGRNNNGACKTKERTKLDKETKIAPPEITEQTNADISVQ